MLKIDQNWSLFLDRDGVINKRIVDAYVTKVEEFEFLENVPKAIAKFCESFGNIFVVTNQQGIAKGIMTESNLNEVHRYMTEKVEDAGGRFTKIYHAPQLHKEHSEMRKPNTGMGLLAQKEFPSVDFAKSVMIGDSDSDIQFGKRLGMITVKIGSGKPDGTKADFYLTTLSEFVNLIEK